MTRTDEVARIFARYLVEVVERHELCPWARGAREQRQIATAVLWGAPALDAWVTEAERLLAADGTRVAIVIAPELVTSRTAFRALRDQVAARIPSAGVAEFFPLAPLDLSTPARLVPFLRRSPDPMLQLVPLALIDAVRAQPPPTAVLAQQAAMLRGTAHAPAPGLGERIALANHATAHAAHAAIAATLDDIAADRRASYARVGIACGVDPGTGEPISESR
ncbi:MAG TPA: hypothetical protein VFK02_25050 [Kofleriaceae bacterium]|nr:hypothetical protein [Kofleriaceae bacterium]